MKQINSKLLSELHRYAIHGNLEMIMYLCKDYENLHYECDMTLLCATEYGNLDIVRYLRSKCVNFSDTADCALLFAVKFKHLEIIKYLCDEGVDISIKYFDTLGLNINKYANFILSHTAWGHLNIFMYFFTTNGKNLIIMNYY